MKNLLFFLLLLASINVHGQTIWNIAAAKSYDDIIVSEARMPINFKLVTVEVPLLEALLSTAPERFKSTMEESPTIVYFPDKDGTLHAFRIQEAPIMEKSLALRYPMIRTYIGQGIDDPGAKLHLSTGTNGIHVMITKTGKPTVFIDPYTRDRSKYILYSRADLPTIPGYECHFESPATPVAADPTAPEKEITDGVMREFNLVIATTIEYSAFHLTNQGIPAGATTAEKKAAVLSAITTTIDRVRGIFETELASTFVFNANQDDVIFIDSDNFTNNNANALIDESQTEIDNIIGNANYDVGHTFSTGGGGLASLGGICTVNSKASAITGSSNPIGDPYDVDFVAHEIGHHFGANHSYNGDGAGNCTTSNASTAAEPGSGSTIMAYAGICSSLNVQNNSDAYFHTVSIKEVNDRFTNSGNFTSTGFYQQCSSNTATGNQEPIADAGQDYTIPKGTAFILNGSANDPDGDAITYCWDQIDLEQPNVYPLASTTTTGPLYRSFAPVSVTERYMPQFETVFGGSLATEWEVTPTVGRNLNFALTARDNRADGGQNTTDEMLVTVSNTAGPFVITSQASETTWSTGQTQTIEWDVAGTTTNNINTANVEIALVDADDNVLSILEASTPNDGSQDITVPNITEENARVRVRALNNIYYALNQAIVAVNTEPGYCNANCASSGSTQFPDGTTRVIFNTINNASSGAPAYTDFTTVSTDVAQSGSYNLTIQVNTDGSFEESSKVWIDWNRDCTLDDATELYDLGNAVNTSDGATSNSPLAIMVPANAELGETIMRVTSYYSGPGGADPGGCSSGFLGEVEDYTLQITAALPVEFVAFTARNVADELIRLDWETATERNNAGFELQRSDDGNVFQPLQWIGANDDGNSDFSQQYHCADDKAIPGQRYYYRLRQVDHDGNFSFSEVASAILNKGTTEINIYPNPAVSRLFVRLNYEINAEERLHLQLFDALGKQAASHTLVQRLTELDLSSLSPGIYFYQITLDGNIIKSEKLIVN